MPPWPRGVFNSKCRTLQQNPHTNFVRATIEGMGLMVSSCPGGPVSSPEMGDNQKGTLLPALPRSPHGPPALGSGLAEPVLPGATCTSCEGKSPAPNICLVFVCLAFPFLPCLPFCFHPSICTGLKIGPWPDSVCASSACRDFGVIPFVVWQGGDRTHRCPSDATVPPQSGDAKWLFRGVCTPDFCPGPCSLLPVQNAPSWAWQVSG